MKFTQSAGIGERRIKTANTSILIEDVTEDIGDLVENTFAFSHLMYNKIIELGSTTGEKKIENLVVSGFSVSSVLAMLVQGADGTWSELVNMGKEDWVKGPKGSTLTQIYNCLHYSCLLYLPAVPKALIPFRTDSNRAFRCLLPQLNSSENFDLKVANKIFIMKGFNPRKEFMDTLRDDFYSEVGETDFAESE